MKRHVLLLFVMALLLGLYPSYCQLRGYLFPVVYRPLVVQVARERHLDPFLVAALIFVESRFRPDEISPQGDRGLMQIQPATLVELERVKLLPKGSDQKVDILGEVEFNVQVGTLYLVHLQNLLFSRPTRQKKIEEWYGGDASAVLLASYNAGPSLVLKLFDVADNRRVYEAMLWRKRPTTARYVEAVLRYYQLLTWVNFLSNYTSAT